MKSKKKYKKLSQDEKKFIWQHRYELTSAQLAVILNVKDSTVRSYKRSKRIAIKGLREAGKRGADAVIN